MHFRIVRSLGSIRLAYRRSMIGAYYLRRAARDKVRRIRLIGIAGAALNGLATIAPTEHIINASRANAGN